MNSLLSQLAKARPGAKYASPAVAGIAALQRMEAKRIALLTPYGFGVHCSFLTFFRENGFEVTPDGTFGTSTDAEIGELRHESIVKAAKAAKALIHPKSPDAHFVSCTATSTSTV
ncbi:hypothetical protein J6524_35840 [Bradyrhizobium sp. WSM 1738]|uniref:aspartate racemase/maleate isomerase family protein n=1 Tax=Bradyrhizobium hereditatis TaxID=2821405 RepID=UPI001CE307FF|nr:hypothetical protein [Bradyrhizobium hereditatis]MCA6120167.1 hypothetical protein [Bradyrhizobium hereditatis]